MRLYHPHYDRKRDRVTRIEFSPKPLEGRATPVATADVEDADAIESLLARGFLPWPGETTPDELEPELEEVGTPDPSSDGPLEGATVQDIPTDDEAGTARDLAPLENLETLTAAELRALADELEVAVPAKATKAEIRQLLTPDV